MIHQCVNALTRFSFDLLNCSHSRNGFPSKEDLSALVIADLMRDQNFDKTTPREFEAGDFSVVIEVLQQDVLEATVRPTNRPDLKPSARFHWIMPKGSSASMWMRGPAPSQVS